MIEFLKEVTSFKFQYDNTLSRDEDVMEALQNKFKFQYDNTLRYKSTAFNECSCIFKFQYDNTLSQRHQQC